MAVSLLPAKMFCCWRKLWAFGIVMAVSVLDVPSFSIDRAQSFTD
jgi:hypothetical protein